MGTRGILGVLRGADGYRRDAESTGGILGVLCDTGNIEGILGILRILSEYWETWGYWKSEAKRS